MFIQIEGHSDEMLYASTRFICLLHVIFIVAAQFGMERAASNIDAQRISQVLPPCPGLWQWGCKNGECIAQYDVCDGIAQCSDGSDEWNCQDVARLRQNPAKAQELAAGGAASLVTTTTTTEIPSASSNIVLTRRQLFGTALLVIVLCVFIVAFIRRRARLKATVRNRRVGLGLLRDDSDEDDILISSMYS